MMMNGPRPITSRANPSFKALRALADDPRAPRREGRTLVDGIHLVATCLARGVRIRQILFSESGRQHPEIVALLDQARGIDSLLFSDALFREIVGVATPTGIAAVIEIPSAAEDASIPSFAGDMVLLDAVQDAGNVGTILRTAAAAGVREVVLGSGCAGAWTPRVLRAGQGAHFSLRIREQVDLMRMLTTYGGTSIATVVHEGENLYALDLRQPLVWLFGNEGAGLAPALIAAARHRVTIPLVATSESLNVAVAAAVCLFEAARQRKA
jgi:TrmH family RNA methyltransferase